MTRKLSLITAVGVAALSVGAPAAFGKVHANSEVAPVLAQPNPMIEDGFAQAIAKSDSVTGFRDAHESGVGSEPQWLKALNARSEGLNKQYGLGEYATRPAYSDASERAVASEPQWLKAMEARSEALNKQYGLGEFAKTVTYRDSFERTDLPRGTVPVSVTTSGTDIEWPQVGVGLGIGLLLALGFGLIMRTTHIRPFAH